MSPLFKQVKAFYMSGQRFETHRTMWAGYEMVDMAKQLKTFAPYILPVYDCLFVQMPGGVVGIVTAINDHGIRIEHPLPQRRNCQWITPEKIEQLGLVKQDGLLEQKWEHDETK